MSGKNGNFQRANQRERRSSISYQQDQAFFNRRQLKNQDKDPFSHLLYKELVNTPPGENRDKLLRLIDENQAVVNPNLAPPSHKFSQPDTKKEKQGKCKATPNITTQNSNEKNKPAKKKRIKAAAAPTSSDSVVNEEASVTASLKIETLELKPQAEEEKAEEKASPLSSQSFFSAPVTEKKNGNNNTGYFTWMASYLPSWGRN